MVTKTNEVHSIDLAWLRRRKLFNVGRWTTLRWSRGGRETGSIRFEVHSGAVRLVYRHQPLGSTDWTSIDERVPLLETATRFGGNRQWFLCLSCSRRCRILFGGARFRCRRCLNLKYETQYEPDFSRAATRALKIRERLGGQGGIDDPFPDKPKGMHWTTYTRLQAEEERLQQAWAMGIIGRFRLEGQDADEERLARVLRE
ncbi:MAG: hypothetical protein KGP27_17340 [Hyphomicrobiales bacterium]|nr:hypothetical protein [Hyphomicrobiales bacterium]